MTEKILMLFRLGIKYLYRYRRRYGFLLIALVFCFAVVTFITSTKDGMYDNVYITAQSHYAGDIIAVGYGIYNQMKSAEISVLLDAVKLSGIKPVYTLFRTVSFNSGIVYFNGNALNLKYVIGSDWENEKHLFLKMDFSSPVDSPLDENSIILSAPVAEHLGAKNGDSIILEVDTVNNQKNTSRYIVKGIVNDASIFGYYKVYISKLSLNRLLLYEDTDCTNIGFFFHNPSAAERNRRILQDILSEKIDMGPLVYNRVQLDEGPTNMVYLLTLPVYLSEVSDLLDAMNLITYFLYGMMLVIIFASAAVTYSLILHERTKEMGVMRAIGFFGGDLRTVLWTEVIILGVISLIAGFLTALLLNFASSFISFSWFPSFEIFLRNGRLTPLYLLNTVLVNIFFTLLILAAAVIVPSLRASRKNLPSLLSGEPL
ncbi:MAG: FtsX-like permease family protein [Treponema sp.]|jgi:ABC-type lipoprotein release transport system permease subunit|nr:FtsX-like permease family protein [Treponema sp.]